MAFKLPLLGSSLNLGMPCPTLVINGLQYNGQVVPYTQIKAITCTPEEVGFEFREGPDGKTPEELVFDIEEGSGHILLDVERIIETHMMQLGIAEYAPDDTDRNVILNKPIFNTRKVNRLFNRAYNVGA
jgi:hypothetical protein